MADKEDKGFEKEMNETLEFLVKNFKTEGFNAKNLENEVHNVFKRHIFKKVKKYPTIVPMIYVL